MKLFLTILVVIFSFSMLFAQCNPNTNKVIVMGDSWAFFSWTYNSFHENFDKYGFTDVKAISDTSVSVLGAHADSYFSVPNRKVSVTNMINANPSVEIVHMSLGGNDFLTMWNKTMSITQSDSIIQEIIKSIRNDVDTIHSINPNLTIYVPGYDFPNFVETAGIVGSSHPFYGMWTNMGQPTALELNSFVVRYQQLISDSIATWNNVFMVNNVGLMQWHYGQTTPLLIFPFSTYPAMSVLLPGGNTNYPSPRVAMGAGGTDSFHLKDGAYEVFLERMVKLFYWKQLRKADASVYADHINSGTVYNDASVSTTQIKTGNSSGLNATGILSFNTAPLDETKSIASARIFLKRKNLVGINPITANLLIGIKSGNYGVSNLLQGDDYLSLSDVQDTACTYGTIAFNDYWMRIDIPQFLLPYFNLTGITQFKLDYLFSDVGRNIDFYNSIDTNYSAVLDVVYGISVSVNKQNEVKNKMLVFPNPVKNNLSITFDDVKAGVLELYSVVGERVLIREMRNSKKITINLTKFSNGTYWLKFTTNKQVLTQRIVVVN